MQLIRQIELHQQGVVVLSADKDGNVKREVEERARQGDWHFAGDGRTKIVLWDGSWKEYVEELQTAEEFLRAEDERQVFTKSLKPLMTAVDCLKLALKPEHETAVMKIEAVGVNRTARTADFFLGESHYTATPQSTLTLDDSRELLELALKLTERRLAAVKAKLNVR